MLVLIVKACVVVFFFFFMQKTAYEIVDCDWSSDVCSSDLCLWCVRLVVFGGCFSCWLRVGGQVCACVWVSPF